MKTYTITSLPLFACAITSASAFWSVPGALPIDTQESDGNATKQHVITPPAPALVKHAADPFITGEYIYWKAEETGLEYAVSGITLGSSISVHNKGHLYQPDFQYHSGFKAGAGLKFRHDSWDLYANYTWLFSDKNSGSSERQEDQALQNTWWIETNDGNVITNIAKASTHWALHFNALDLELGRNYFISPRLTLRPHFGLKGSWIDQDLHCKYTYPIESDSPNTVIRYPFDQDQWGVGIRLGLNTTWFMWNKWSLFGNVAGALMYSDFEIHQKTTVQQPSQDKFTSLNLDKHLHTIIPVVELSLGIRFQTDFYKQNYQFLLQAGWEEQIWFDMNQFSNHPDRYNGNLTLEGLTVKTGFAF